MLTFLIGLNYFFTKTIYCQLLLKIIWLLTPHEILKMLERNFFKASGKCSLNL